MPSRAILRRRELLGALGASAFLATPVFRQTLAEAQSNTPKRAIFFQWPGGVPSMCFQTGGCVVNDYPDNAFFDFSGQLAPLVPLKADTILIKNLKAAAAERWKSEGHEAGMRTMLTAGGDTSVDQLIAKQVGNLTKFASLQFAGLPWEGTPPQDRISYSGGFALQQERDPVVMFDKLFSGFSAPAAMGSAPDPVAELKKARGKSALDFLTSEITTLQGMTSSGEKPILDVHLESLRELEKQLTQVATAVGTACAAPDQTGIKKGQFTMVDDTAPPVDIRPIAKLQLDLLYQAINCDLTRVATFQWATSVETTAMYNFIPGFAGSPDMHHGYQHEHEDPATEAVFQGIQTWYMEQMASLAARLKATAEGGGSILDNSLLMMTSEFSNGTHIFSPMPMVIVGRAGGALQKVGQTIDANWVAHNDLLLAIASAMGVPLNTIGDADLCKGPLAI